MKTIMERFMRTVADFMRYLRRQWHYQRRLMRELRTYFEAKFRALLRPLYRALRAEGLEDLYRALRETTRLPPEERRRARREILTRIAEEGGPESRRRAWELLAEMDALERIERWYRDLERLVIPRELERLPGPLYRQAAVAKDDFIAFKEKEIDFLAELAERFETIGRPDWAERCRRLARAAERMIERIKERWESIPGYRVAEFAKYYKYEPVRSPNDARLFELRIRVTLPIWKEITDELRRFVNTQMNNIMEFILAIAVREEGWTIKWAEGPECWPLGVEDGLNFWPRYEREWPWVCLDWRDLYREQGREPTCEERRMPVTFDWEEWRYRSTGEYPEGLRAIYISGPPEMGTQYHHHIVYEGELPDCPIWQGTLLARQERIGIDLDTHDPWALKVAIMRAWMFGPVEWEKTEHGYHIKIMTPWPWPEYDLAIRYLVGLGLEDPIRFHLDCLRYRAGLWEFIDTLFTRKWEPKNLNSHSEG